MMGHWPKQASASSNSTFLVPKAIMSKGGRGARDLLPVLLLQRFSLSFVYALGSAQQLGGGGSTRAAAAAVVVEGCNRRGC